VFTVQMVFPGAQTNDSCQKSPIFSQKSPIFSQIALYSLTKARSQAVTLYLRCGWSFQSHKQTFPTKRALYSLKRAMYFLKLPCILSQKRADRQSQCAFGADGLSSPTNKYFLPKEPYILSKEPYILSQKRAHRQRHCVHGVGGPPSRANICFLRP